MGNWTVWLSQNEEEEIKKLIQKGKFRNPYRFIQNAVRRALEWERKQTV